MPPYGAYNGAPATADMLIATNQRCTNITYCPLLLNPLQLTSLAALHNFRAHAEQDLQQMNAMNYCTLQAFMPGDTIYGRARVTCTPSTTPKCGFSWIGAFAFVATILQIHHIISPPTLRGAAHGAAADIISNTVAVDDVLPRRMFGRRLEHKITPSRPRQQI